MGDLKPVLERIVALRQSIVDDGIANGVPFHSNDQRTLVERLKSEGTSFIKVTLPILGKALDQGLVSGEFKCPAHFRLKRDSRLPVFLGHVFCMVFEDCGALRERPHLGSIYFLRQYLLLDGKLIVEPTVVQENIAFNDFVWRQAALRERRVPKGHPVVERAKRLLGRVLRNLDLADITPGHGPGGVAEKLDRAERWSLPAWPVRAERWYPYHIYGTPSFQALCQDGPPVMTEQSITRCCLVPKDFKGPRLISAESTATQYLQQGQMRMMMDYMDRHPLLSKSIRLRDQTFNQRLCQHAYDSGACTLDLSNASDNVSAALVWYLFAEVPRLRSQLFCTRSQAIQLGSEVVKLASFSPMGSAVCFPVETLVFWSLTLASVRHVHSQWAKSGYGFSLPGLKESASCIAVFGDDIIVPDYALQTLIGTLESVGCEINKSKTCYQTPFRESCGSEWYKDIDVSITRNRRYHYDSARNIANYPVVLDLQRKFFLQGLVRTAALLREWARVIAPIVTISVSRFIDVVSIVCPSSPFWGLGQRRHEQSDKQCGRYNRMDVPAYGGSATAFPSGLDVYVRSESAVDTYCGALWFDTSLDSGVRTRYNANYQRHECRLPAIFQHCRQWDTNVRPDTQSKRKFPSRKSRNCDLKQVAALRLSSGYPRLMARIVGDSVDRIAIRSFRLKMAWSELPISGPFSPLYC